MGLPDLYPAQVGSPYTTLSAPYTSGESTMTLVDATKLPDAPNIVCLTGDVAGEFKYTGKDGNTLTGVTKLSGTPNATWPAGTYAFRGVSAYDHASIVEHLTFQRSHIVEASLDLTTNHSYSGRVLEGAEAGENLAFGDLAVLAESGKFVKANPATLATLDGTIALVVSDTIAAGSQGMFLLRGLIRNDSWTFSPGKELYASNGALTHEPPTTGTQIIRKVGTALTATIIEFNPSSALHAEYLVSVLPVNTISKDNNDIERKFFKDDFSVDSSSQYTGDVASFTWDTANKILSVSASATTKSLSSIKTDILLNDIGLAFRVDSSDSQNAYARICFIDFNIDADNFILLTFRRSADPIAGELKLYKTVSGVLTQIGSTYAIADTTGWHRVNITYNRSTGAVAAYLDGVSRITGTVSDSVFLEEGYLRLRANTGDGATPVAFEFMDLTALPSTSYSDDFSTDTSERYQAVTGTVAYDDANKRMNVTTATGANGKASGRLKSYKFCEGSQIYDVLLPTGADGDFICLATHSANGLMTNGIGVGLQSDGAGNWNLATLSGTTVTEGADSGLDDADVARIEIEKDLSGAYWYYIYDAAGTKPTTATGKLFTALTEGYTGWYANGNSKTYAIENISIRAESIVGRTNVEVTEDVFNSVTGEIESRTYFKPIHRGAMLESYHDGTQEVVGTTFVDDCNWDRLDEYQTAPNSVTSFTWDPADAVYVCDHRSGSGLVLPIAFTDGYVSFKIKGSFNAGIALRSDGVINPDSTSLPLNGISITNRYRGVYVNGTKVAELTPVPLSTTDYTHVEVLVVGTFLAYWADGVKIYSGTVPEIATGYDKIMIISYGNGSEGFGHNKTHIKDLNVVASSSDATNGIAACIPSIGGGARYGVEESVYIPITPGTEIPVGSAVISPNTKSTVVGTSLTTFAQTPAGVSASLEYATGTKACPGLSTAFAPAGRHRVKADRNTLTNIGVKGSAAGTSPTIYIDSLHVRKQEAA